VLVAGGATPSGVSNTAELYSPDGTFAPAPAMNAGREDAACTTLADGRVLVTGGSDGTSALSSAEVFDPSAGTWTAIPGGMSVARSGHTATLLPWGSVLIAGGEPGGTVELFQPNGTFQRVGSLAVPREQYALAALPNYRVLIAGGTDGQHVLDSVEVFNALDNSITMAGTMLTARRMLAASPLLDGTVLMTGGYDSAGNPLKSTEIFDPARGSSNAGPDLATARAGHQSYALANNGTVLLIGGTDGSSSLSSSEMYPFWAGRFLPAAPMDAARRGMTASLLQQGSLVVAGGRNPDGLMAGSEVYGFATIAAARPEYHPGETASISGAGFVPGEQVQVRVTALPADQHNTEFTASATADAAGRVSVSGFPIDQNHVGTRFLATATGSQSIAQSTFTDALAAGVMFNSPPASGTFGTNSSFIVTVSGTAETPAGTVTLTDTTHGNVVVAAAVGLVNGSATLTTDSIQPGSGLTLTATYNPAAGSSYGAGSGTTTFSQAKAHPDFTLQLPSGLIAGQYFTATVNGSALVPGIAPSNSARLNVGAEIFPPAAQPAVPLVNGSASFTNVYTHYNSGTQTFSIATSGNDLYYLPCTACNVVTANVSKASPTVTVSIAPAVPPTSPPTYNVTVSSPAGNALTPTGTVVFTDGTNTSAATGLNNGTASYTPPAALPAGFYTVGVTYSGDADFLTGNGSSSYTVPKPAPAVTVTSNGTPSLYGVPLTFTASVVGSNGITPTGSVQFFDGSTSLGVANLVSGTAPSASATLALSTPLAAGSHSITATYNGDGNYATFTSSAWTQVVNSDTVNISLGTSQTNVVVGQPITLSSTITPAQSPNSGVPTGTVTFYDGANAITGSPVTIPANSETATLSNVTLGVGTHNAVTAKYSGDANFSTATSAPITVTVGKAQTATAISTITPAAVTYGQSNITVTAAVTVSAPGAGTPTGSITFYDGSASGPVLGSATVSSGIATIQIAANSPLANPLIGVHNIVAVYGGDTSFQASTSSSTTQSQLTVSKAATTTTVISSSSQSVVGQTLMFTATVLGTGSGSAPSGTITFSSNGTPIGTANVAVAGGIASASLMVPSSGVAALPVGTTVISAAYSGDGNYNASTSPLTVGAGALQQVVSKAATTIVLTTSTNPSNQAVTLTATVSVTAPGAGTPTGTVTFYNTANNIQTALGSGTLATSGNANQFVAAITLAQLPQGTPSLTAIYGGDASFLGSSSSSVTSGGGSSSKAAVTVSLTPNANPSVLGQPVTLTATVTPVAPATGTPTGTVTFIDTGNQLGTVTLLGGVATFTTGTLSVGTHAISASYSGDATYQPYFSPSLPEVISRIPSFVTVTSSSTTAVVSQIVTFTAQITPYPPSGVNAPTGSVTFFDGSNQIGAGPVSSGVATFSTAGLSPGVHNILAVYSGDINWTGSTSAFQPETVTLAQTSIQMTGSPNPSVWGQAVTYTISVAVAAPGVGPVGGQVQLFDNAVAVGQAATLVNGSAQVTLTGLAPGKHNIIAQYPANSSYSGSSSPAFVQIVNQAGTTTTLAAVPNGSTTNPQVTFTAVVTVTAPGAGSPTGSVQFLDATSNTVLGTVFLVNVAGVYTATYTLSQPSQTILSDLLTAVYSGDTDFAGSTSAAQQIAESGAQITVTNAASYSSNNLSPGGAAAIFANNLTNTTLIANTLPLPTMLGGVSVTILDNAGNSQQAQLYFVSPTQANFLMPANAALGLATVTVTNANGATSAASIVISQTGPGIFTANQTGQGVAQALVVDVAPGGGQTRLNTALYSPITNTWTANPIAMNPTDSYFLELYGTGIRNATSGQVSATINGQSVQVVFAGAQAQYPGLDQVDLAIPANLKGAGTVNVVLTVNGQAANPVTISLQ